MKKAFATFAVLVASAGAWAASPREPSTEGDWPHWRGPSFDGSAPAKNLPLDFSKEKHVRWSASLPGAGASTPIVVGERVFLTAIDSHEGALLAICLDRQSGAERWVKVAGSGYQPGGKGEATSIHGRSNYASPSAVTDGERVVFFFGNGDLVCYSLGGDEIWTRNLQKDYGDFAFQWTFSASPTIFGGQLFLPVLQRNQPANGLGKAGAESFLLAIDPTSGKTNYRHVRPSDAVMESLESYATPIPYVGANGREEILLVGGDVITGHDPKTGAELWRWGTWNEGHREQWWRVVPSPVVGAGVALACGPKGAPVCAVPLGGEKTMEADALRWRSAGRRDPVTTDVPTPLFYDGDFFVLSDLRSALTRVDAKTGEAEWSTDLPGKQRWRASPTGADGRIWLMDHGANVVVVDATSGDIVHSVAMGEADDDFTRSTIAVAGDGVFIRTNRMLFCIGS